MNPALLLTILRASSVGLIGIVLVCDVLATLQGSRPWRLSAWLRALLVLALTGAILLEFAADERRTWSRRESLASFGIAILAIAAVINARAAVRRPTGNRAGAHLQPVLFIGSLVATVLVAVASSPLVPPSVDPMLPVLRSAWLPIHVGFSFVGEAFLTIAFAGSITWLWRARGRPSSAATDLAVLDRFVYRTVLVGYGLFTAGALVFGAIWANQAWGRYWGWDPKETWALVTWVAYSVYLHVRIRGPRRARLGHWIVVIAYLSALFTLFGVNLLYRSLHAY